jgi:hypothetical protein
MTGKVEQQWASSLLTIWHRSKGNPEQPEGKIQERYSRAKDEFRRTSIVAVAASTNGLLQIW